MISDKEIKPFELNIEPSEIEGLKFRSRGARWPEKETVDDWSQGVPLDYHREFCEYWAEKYDWFATQNRLNEFPQFVTAIDGIEFHFIQVKSKHSHATPLMITHGWPGSVVEFHKAIDPLVSP